MDLYEGVMPPEETKLGRPKVAEPKYPFNLIEAGQVLCIEAHDVPRGGTASIRSALNTYKRKNNIDAEFRIAPFPENEGAIGVWRIK